MASVYQKNKWYYIDFTDKDGRRKTRALKTTKKSEADDRASIIIRNLAEGRSGILKPNARTFEEVAHMYYDHIDAFVSEGWANRQKKEFNRFLIPHFKDRFIHTLDMDSILEYLAKAKKGRGLKERTLNIQRAMLIKFFELAKRKKFIVNNPMLEVKRFKQAKVKKEYLTPAEVMRLRATALDYHVPYMALVIDLGVFAGLRKKEILNLPKENMTTGEVVVANTTWWSTKTKDNRVIPVLPPLRETYQNYTPHLKCRTLIWQKNGVPVGDYKKALKQVCKLADIPKSKANSHALRHTFATLSFHSGIDATTIRDVLGHYSIQTTNEYAHAMPSDQKRKEMSKLLEVLQ